MVKKGTLWDSALLLERTPEANGREEVCFSDLVSRALRDGHVSLREPWFSHLVDPESLQSRLGLNLKLRSPGTGRSFGFLWPAVWVWVCG